MQKALFIDGNALIHRTWHALPRLTAPDGRVVNAVYGFVMVLQKVLQSEHPDYLVVCWDTPEPTYRHRIAPEYKAQREKQPQEFYDQVPFNKMSSMRLAGRILSSPAMRRMICLQRLPRHSRKRTWRRRFYERSRYVASDRSVRPRHGL